MEEDNSSSELKEKKGEFGITSSVWLFPDLLWLKDRFVPHSGDVSRMTKSRGKPHLIIPFVFNQIRSSEKSVKLTSRRNVSERV